MAKLRVSAGELRAWQQDALAKLLRTPDDFLAVATPGAGKTFFALTAAMRLMERGEIRHVVVVAPTAHLRAQWKKAAAALGLTLDSKITNKATGIAPGTDGAVITFSMAASAPLVWEQITTQSATLAILDEVHHCGDKRDWGPALKKAFSPAVRRLLLSGTPFRSDRTPIPFVKYRDGRCAPDYEYGYAAALADGIVRPVQFHALDGDMTWQAASRIAHGKLSGAASKKAVSAALTAAYDPEGSWIRSVFEEANETLRRHRESTPDAGGLVLAPDQESAASYAGILEEVVGEKPVLAISQDRDASRRIAEFAESSARWIVAVQMVSEGVDIPRLEVGVYASRVQTELFFRQVVGRFVRMRGARDSACATLFIPSVRAWLRHAANIEHTVESVLRIDADDEAGQLPGIAGERGIVEAVESSDATLFATVHAGESFTDEELRRAESLARAAGLPGNVTAIQIARALRLAEEDPVDPDAIERKWRWARKVLGDPALVTPKGNLRNGALAQLVEDSWNKAHKPSRRYIQDVLRLGRAYPTAAHARKAEVQFNNWKTLVNAGFPPIEDAAPALLSFHEAAARLGMPERYTLAAYHERGHEEGQ